MPVAPCGPLITMLAGNDTPEDIACDTALHQSIGTIQTAAPALHDLGGAPAGLGTDVAPPILPDHTPPTAATVRPARTLYPPSPPTLKHRPLLI
jgi:hypothetical protein